MNSRKLPVLSLDAGLRAIRNAAHQRKRPDLEINGKGVVLRVGNTVAGLVTESPSPVPVMGCDLEAYSGLSDLQQYFVGAVIPITVRRAQKYAGLRVDEIIGVSGTGDGALVALQPKELWQAVLFAARLSYEGKECAFSRGLRVALARGSCFHGEQFGGVAQMQGYGLIETARILGCDKSTHFMISLSVWNIIAGEGILAADGVFGTRNIHLRRTSTIFRGKFKPTDSHETAYVNCFGSVSESNGHEWQFGLPHEKRLQHPGNKSREKK